MAGKVTEQKNGDAAGARLVKIPAACQILACSRSRLYQLMDAGELESVKDGKSRKLVVASIDAYVARLREAAA